MSHSFNQNPFKNSFNFSMVAAACLLANAASYAGRASSSYSTSAGGRNTYAGRMSTSQLLPLPTRAYIDGTLAPTGFLYGDVMSPVVGNTEGFAFLDGTAKGGTDKGWFGAFGGGLREIWRGMIFGGYVFGEYDRTALGNNFWTITPGVEFMTPHWDLRFNGYIPLEKKEYVNAVYSGMQLGITCPIFKGHQQFDRLFKDVNEIAPGVDGQIGYIIPNLRRARVFGGGYYYFFEEASDIRGFVAGLEMPISRSMSLLFRDSYDNVNRNTAVLTLRAYFGGMNKVDENDIHERLLDPMERHIGVLYTGAGIPTQNVLYDAAPLVKDNIWFFRSTPGSTGAISNLSACTFENPCDSTQFNQANANNIDSIAKGANFYLADGGIYTINNFTLNYGQSIYGRTADFCQVAPGSPVLLGGITVLGNNTLQGFRLINNVIPTATSPINTGITAINVPNIVIDRVTVGAGGFDSNSLTVPAGNFEFGIYAAGVNSIAITNSVVHAGDTSGSSGTAVGIYAYDSTITMDNLNLNVLARSDLGLLEYATGVNLNKSKGVLQNSKLDVVDARIGYVTYTEGVRAIRGSTLSLVNNNISLRASGVANKPGPEKAYLQISGVYARDSYIDMQDNHVRVVGDANVTNSGYAYVATSAVLGVSLRGEKTVINSRNNTMSVDTLAVQTTSVGAPGFAVPGGAGLYGFGDGPDASVVINSQGDKVIVNSLAQNDLLYGQAIVFRNFGVGIISTNFADVRINTTGDLLLISGNSLAPQGLAYVSYNGGFGILARTGGVGVINSSKDTVQCNMNASTTAGIDDPAIFANPLAINITGGMVASYTNGKAILNINGDTFNIQSSVNGLPRPANFTRGTAAIGRDGGVAQVNVANSTFYLEGLINNSHSGAQVAHYRMIQTGGGIASVTNNGLNRYVIL